MRSNPLKLAEAQTQYYKKAFISWARANLSKDDVDRILKISRTCAKTVDAVGSACALVSDG